MFVLAVSNVTFGIINYSPIANDCGCGCGRKDEGSPMPIDKGKQSQQGFGDEDLVMICQPDRLL